MVCQEVNMEIQFILERVHTRNIFSTRAYRIFFTDTEIYFIHLGEDASQLPLGQVLGGLAGAIGQSIAEKQTEKAISGKLDQLEAEGLDNVIAKDKRSFKALYSHLESFKSDSYKWNRWPHVTFKIRGKGSFKFTFDLQMENLEDERQAIVEFMRDKCPNLVK